MEIQRGYDDVEVERVQSCVRVRQKGDDTTDEVYIPFSELESVLVAMWEVKPRG